MKRFFLLPLAILCIIPLLLPKQAKAFTVDLTQNDDSYSQTLSGGYNPIYVGTPYTGHLIDSVRMHFQSSTTGVWSYKLQSNTGGVSSACINDTAMLGYVTFTWTTPFIQGSYFILNRYDGTTCVTNISGDNGFVGTLFGHNGTISGWSVPSPMQFNPNVPYLVSGLGLPVGSMTITTPVNNSTLIYGQSTTISGYCPINGTNEIQVNSWSPKAGVLDGSGSDVDCVAHAYSSTFIPTYGPTYIYVIDKNFYPLLSNDSYYASLLYQATDPNTYSLSIISPPCTDNVCTNLKPSNDWTFQWKYNLPTTDLTKYTFNVDNCTDGTYSSCTNAYTVLFSVNDADKSGTLFYTHIHVVDSTETFYSVQIEDNVTSTVKFSLNFKTIGSTAAGALDPKTGTPDSCSNTWCEFMRAMFYPSQGTIKGLQDDLPLLMNQRIPFAYFSAVKDMLQSAISDTSGMGLHWNMMIGNMNISFLNTNNSVFQTYSQPLRPYMVYGLWLGFITFLWAFVRNIKL